MALNGSPRPEGNTSHLLKSFLEGAGQNSVQTEVLHPHRLDLNYCTGCLRCNMLKRCSIGGDDWADISGKILEADVLVFAAPVYFHHLPAPMKAMLDRFRSFIHVQITESGLNHRPWRAWNKDFVLILTMGSSDIRDADPVIDLFRFMTSILGENNKLHVITASRLAVVKQVVKSEGELKELYGKMKLPAGLAPLDFKRNQEVMELCKKLGQELSKA